MHNHYGGMEPRRPAVINTMDDAYSLHTADDEESFLRSFQAGFGESLRETNQNACEGRWRTIDRRLERLHGLTWKDRSSRLPEEAGREGRSADDAADGS